MTNKVYDKDNPRFRDEFGSVNDLLTGESYLCGESGFIGERDAIDTAEALCDLLNNLYDENEQLKQDNTQFKILVNELKNQNQKLKGRLNDLGVEYYD